MSWAAQAIVALVIVQRLVELRLSERNTRRLLAEGAVEYGAGHYAFLIALHMAWLGSLFWLGWGRPINWWLLGLFALLQLGRIWVIATLRERWTTRIIVKPDAPLIRSGPYRFLNHPNYLIVTLEIAVLPLVFGLWVIALIFSLLNLIVLAIRIHAENKALASSRPRS